MSLNRRRLLWLAVGLALFFFTATLTPAIYTLSLHDALPISRGGTARGSPGPPASAADGGSARRDTRSEEHTSELQSRVDLVCRLLLEKKNLHNSTISHL